MGLVKTPAVHATRNHRLRVSIPTPWVVTCGDVRFGWAWSRGGRRFGKQGGEGPLERHGLVGEQEAERQARIEVSADAAFKGILRLER